MWLQMIANILSLQYQCNLVFSSHLISYYFRIDEKASRNYLNWQDISSPYGYGEFEQYVDEHCNVMKKKFCTDSCLSPKLCSLEASSQFSHLRGGALDSRHLHSHPLDTPSLQINTEWEFTRCCLKRNRPFKDSTYKIMHYFSFFGLLCLT